MSLDDVARVTKIQPRILERLEAGRIDGLPAEVFVRGFVRSFARCVGLDESEALRRYAAATGLAAGTEDLTPTVRALVEAMSDLAPDAAIAARATPRKMHAVEVIDLAPMMPEPSTLVARTSTTVIDASDAGAAAVVPPVASASSPEPMSSKKKRSRRRKARAQAALAAGSMAGLPRGSLAVGTPPTASPIVTEAAAVVASAPGAPETSTASEAAAASTTSAGTIANAVTTAPAAAAAVATDEPGEPAATWSPRMPPIAAPSVPWRRPAYPVPAAAPAAVAPSLVIDDADPESAERVLEERAEKLVPRR
jgi:hypothetical protein